MVSYMYQYENGVKRKNVGFAKVEAKGGLCKFTLHMQLLGQLDSIFPTYLIQRNTGNLELVYLGDAVLKNQVMDSRLTAEENNIMGTGFKLSDMGGILLFLHDNIFFATEWDDKPIVAEEVLAALRPKKSRHYGSKDATGFVKESMKVKESQASSNANPYNYINPTNDFTSPVTQIDSPVIPAPDMVQAARDANYNGFSTIVHGIGNSTLEEELQIPKYKLPGGFKMIERLQRPYVAEVVPTQVMEEVVFPAKTVGAFKDLSEEMKRSIDLTTGPIDNKKDLIFVKEPEAIQNNEYNNIYLKYDTEVVEEGYDREENSKVNESRDVVEGNILDRIPESEQEEARADGVVEKDLTKPSNVQDEISNELAVDNNSVPAVGNNLVHDIEEENTEGLSEQENVPDPITAQQFFNNYPRIYPFEDNEVMLCVKIEPKDIGMLPKEVWPYSNNSFLMHGFYCYHHLIFAKMKNRYGSRYILGVPGIFHNREQFMAKMFGFENFKSMKKSELKQGDFGYWFLPVEFI